MKPTLEEAIEQLKVTTEPPEQLQRRLESMANSPAQRKSRGRDWLAVGAVGVAIAGLSFAALRLNVTPPPVPPVSTAKTSAQTTLSDANKQIRALWKKADFMVIGDDIRARQKVPDGTGRRWRWLTGSEEIEARKKVLDAYKEPLKLAHRAMGEPFIPPRQDVYTINDYSDKNPFTDYYSVANLLCVEVRVKADKGDLEGALKAALDIISLGTQLGQNVQWHGWQGAGGVVYSGWREIKRLTPLLSASQAQEAAHELELLETKRPPLSKMFQATRWAAYKTFQTKSWDQCMFDFVISYGPRSTLALKATPKAWIIAEHLRYLEALENYAKGSRYPEKRLPSAPKDAFNQYMEHYMIQVFESERLSRTSAALVIAQLRRHTDPKAVLPEDPFAPGKTLRERADGLIYSVGPDGVDNQGMALKRTDGPGDISQLL